MNKITQKNQIIIYSLLFALILVVCYACFWHKGLLPIYGTDGLGQYYPVFMYTGRAIREFFSPTAGGGSFRFYDLSVGMGEDLFGTLNYYGFGDPVNILAVFATGLSGPYLFAASFYLRLYLGGLAFMLYCKRFGIRPVSVVVASVCYAFCGYAVYAGGMYIEYASMLYVFPLLLAGCERILHRERGRWILFASAWYLGLCGFYFTYMCTLFLVVYCAVRACFIGGRDDAKGTVISCLRCALIFALGLCCAAPVLLPSLAAFLSSARSSSTGLGQLLVLSNYIPSLNRRFVSDANIMNGLRNYPVMLGAFSVFFLKTDKRMVQLRIAVISLFILLYLPITAIAFNGFSNPRDRWVFEAQFVLCVAFAAALDRIGDMEKKRLLGTALILTLCNIVTSFWGRYSSLGEDEKHMYVTASQAIEETSSPVTACDLIKADDDLFRVSGDFTSPINERPLNDGMNGGYFGDHYWFSVVNENTQAIVDEATGISNDWRSFGLGSKNEGYTAAAVKYYLAKESCALQGFKESGKFEYGEDTWHIYENENFGGFARIEYEAGDITASCTGCTYRGNEFSCTIPADAADAAVITAFPYARGWSAYINGNKTDTVNASHYLAVKAKELHKGDVVMLSYRSPGFIPGVMVAICSLLAFIAVELLCRYRSKSVREELK